MKPAESGYLAPQIHPGFHFISSGLLAERAEAAKQSLLARTIEQLTSNFVESANLIEEADMKNHTIAAVAAFFAIILGIQTYMLFRLHDRVDQLSGQKSPTDNLANNWPDITKPPLPKTFPDQDFFSDQPWNPYDEMQRMQDEMEKLFGDSFSRFHLNSPLGSLSKSPAIDLQDQSDHYLVTVNAPGAEESSINVKLDGQMLTISIKTEQGKQEEDQNDDYRYRERFVGEFHRVLTLPGPVDADNMKTEYRNGVLTITIPKKS